MITNVSAWLASHPAIGEAFSNLGKDTGATVRGGVGVAGDVKGVKGEASATVYVGSTEKGLNVGVDGKVEARVAAVGAEATGNIPIVKDGKFVNPLKEANLSGAGTLTGDLNQKANVSGSGNPEQVSVGETYGEGVVVGGEVTNSGFSKLTHAIGDAIIEDVTNAIKVVERDMDLSKNPN